LRSTAVHQVNRQGGDIMKKPYSAPVVRELGSLQQLTAQQFNKVGSTADLFSTATNNQVVGSLIGL
jgi:hypothetical protein